MLFVLGVVLNVCAGYRVCTMCGVSTVCIVCSLCNVCTGCKVFSLRVIFISRDHLRILGESIDLVFWKVQWFCMIIRVISPGE